MRIRSLAAILGVLLVLGPLPASGSAGKARSGGTLRGDLGPAEGSPVAAAAAALDRFDDRLGIDASDFSFDRARRSLVGVHVRGSQVRGGVAVDGTVAAVDIVDGRIWQVKATSIGLPGRPATAPVSRDGAVAAAVTATEAHPVVAPSATRLLVPVGDRLADTWRVAVLSFAPAVAATVDVDAATGAVRKVRDDRRFADGTATVFDPNAVVALKDSTVRQPGVDLIVDTDLDSPELTAARTTLAVREVDPTFLPAGRMVGPWVDVRGTPGLDPDATFEYTRGDPRFETTMAYTHLDRLQRYFQALGFTGEAGVNAEPQDVYTIRVEGFDNSFYMPSNDLMLFGAGGVDDAEDAEVIVHEYGHAVQDAQVPGWGNTHEGGSMGEGFGDWLAGNYYAGSISEGFQDECIADWDATSYSNADPPCLRRLDEDKHYPEDMEGGVHADGEIWSAFLWTMRNRLVLVKTRPIPTTTLDGSRPSTSEIRTANSTTLVLASHEFLTPDANFADGVAGLEMAAAALGQPRWASQVHRLAIQFGFLEAPSSGGGSGPAQPPISGSVRPLAPGLGERVMGVTAEAFEFDSLEGFDNATAEVLARPALPADIDLYLQLQQDDGSWSGDLASAESGSTSQELLTTGRLDPGHYRVIVQSWLGPPAIEVALTITFFNTDGAAGE
ncbi:MAG: M36 family metallopeptidase [Actinomycetota bacterium]